MPTGLPTASYEYAWLVIVAALDFAFTRLVTHPAAL
jgi:hypothetical protein